MKHGIDECYARMGSHDGSKYARGLSSEGYMGGYAAALNDVLLLLDGVEPDTRSPLAKPMTPNDGGNARHD